MARLTDPQAIAEWLMPNDFQPRLGHRFQFRVANAKGWSGVVDCEVTELTPPRRLAYTWASDRSTRVAWTLEPRRKAHVSSSSTAGSKVSASSFCAR